MVREHNGSRTPQHARSVERPTASGPDVQRCPVCDVAVKLTQKTRLLSKHRTNDGYECPNRRTRERIELAALPPVEFDARVRPPRIQRAADEPSRLDAGSNCQDCGKWLPGERRLCGRCLNRRGNV